MLHPVFNDAAADIRRKFPVRRLEIPSFLLWNWEIIVRYLRRECYWLCLSDSYRNSDSLLLAHSKSPINYVYVLKQEGKVALAMVDCEQEGNLMVYFTYF